VPARTDLGLISQRFVSIRGHQSLLPMITLPYSLIIEAIEDPDFLAFILPTWMGYRYRSLD